MEVGVQPTERGKQPARTCVGCRGTGSPHELVRVVAADDGSVAVDLSASAFGRGAWLHARPECIRRAAPRGLSKSFRMTVKTGSQELTAAIAEAADRRILGLLASARSSRRLAAGSTAALDEISAGRARLVIVASDARAAASGAGVQQMIESGRAAAWGNKQSLGAALGRGDIGVVAVLDEGIARALSSAIGLSHVRDSKFSEEG
jgi:predicted RNA-binding protein YlxR (DUF448 family)/ribosomal protein L30E